MIAFGIMELRVLVVEDEPAVGRTLTRLLGGGCAWSVTVATSASEARVLLEDRSTRWLGFVVDVGLPEGPEAGLKLLSFVRESFPRAPTAVVTGRLERSIVNAAASLGASFICKPPAATELAPFVARVAALARNRRDTDQVALSASNRFGLTARETQVLGCALRGDGSDKFCERESISRRTFRAHAASVVSKSGAPSLRELALRLMREELGPTSLG
jgi:two-component system nitrate/nitrite response regulator NarL